MSAPKPPPGHFTVLFFASAATHTSKTHDSLPAPVLLSRLPAELESRYPGIRAKILDSSLMTVNLEYVDVPPVEGHHQDGDKPDKGDFLIRDGDEVAIIPPVSSG